MNKTAPNEKPTTDLETIWEGIYSAEGDRHKNEFPSEVVVSWTKRNFSAGELPQRNRLKCLDLGCGWGNNLKFLKEEGFDSFGIDVSDTAINRLQEDFRGKVFAGTFVELPFEDEFFDFCIDRSSIQNNGKDEILNALNEVHRVLKPGGRFFSMMLKEGNTEFETTKFSEDELKDALQDFSSVEVNYLTQTWNHGKVSVSYYLIDAEK